jgi:DNA-binding transcriptional LysR family regulator
MDARRVLTFRAVAREGSFSKAAELLSLSQPSVSVQVAALERELGMKLLDRGGRGVSLTPAGAVLLLHADAIADRFAVAARQLSEMAAAEPVRLRIGAFPTALGGFVPAAIDRLKSSHPEASVTVEDATSEVLPPRVRSGELHIAVTFQDAAHPRREHDGTERIDLLREAFLVSLPPEHPRADQALVALAELVDDDWTAASPDGIIVSACRAAGFEPRLVSLCRDQLAIRSLVVRNLAVTLAPQLLVEAFAGTTLRPIDGAAPQRDIYAVLPEGERHPLVRPMLTALRETAEALGLPPTPH